MSKQVILNTLDELKEEEYERFKWFLKDERLKGSSTIPQNKLENAKTWNTVDLMIQTYALHGAVKVTKQLLKKINRNDLLESLCDSSSKKGVCNSADGPSSSPPPPLPTDKTTDAEASEVVVCNSADGPSSSQPPPLPTDDRTTDDEPSEVSAGKSMSLLKDLELFNDPLLGLDKFRMKPGLGKYSSEMKLATNSENTTSLLSRNKRKLEMNQSFSSDYSFWPKWLRRK